MRIIDSGYSELLKAIQNYFEERRRFSVSGTLETTYAENLCLEFKKWCPNLESSLSWELPASICAKKIISFAVKGLNDPAYYNIWNQYFLDGQSIKNLSKQLNYSERNITRFKSKLSILITEQLIVMNSEVLFDGEEFPMTTSQYKQSKLIKFFGFTKRQAEVLLAFHSSGEHQGEKTICGNLSLSPSGLKKHIRKIIRKMGVENRKDALKKVAEVLEATEPE